MNAENNDLSRNASAMPVIDWHGEMLEQRAEGVKNGTDHFITLTEAEVRIREKKKDSDHCHQRISLLV